MKWRFGLQRAYGIINKGSIAALTQCCYYKSGLMNISSFLPKTKKVNPVLSSEDHGKSSFAKTCCKVQMITVLNARITVKPVVEEVFR